MSDDRRPRLIQDYDPIDPSMLGETLARIAELTSLDVAVTLATQFGGRTIYVPTVHGLRDSSPLVRAVGIDAVKIISEAFGKGELRLPSCRSYLRYARARKLRRQGLSISQISKIIGVGGRQVSLRVRGVPKGIGGSTVDHSSVCPTCGAARRLPEQG